MSIQPRSASSLDYVALWEPAWKERRLEELTQAFMTKLEFEEQEKMRETHFKEQIRLKKPLPPPQWTELAQGEKHQRYYDKARRLAQEILDQERKIYVDSRAERDKNMIIEVARRLRSYVFIVNEKGVAEKDKIIVEHVVKPNYRGDFVEQDEMYMGEHDFERFNLIIRLKNRLEELKDFYPYYSDEVKALYDQAMELASLQVVRKEKAKS